MCGFLRQGGEAVWAMSRVSVTESSFRRLPRTASEEPRRLSVAHRGSVPDPSHIDSLSMVLPPSTDPGRPTSRVRSRLCSQRCDVGHRRGLPRVAGPATRGARGGGRPLHASRVALVGRNNASRKSDWGADGPQRRRPRAQRYLQDGPRRRHAPSAGRPPGSHRLRRPDGGVRRSLRTNQPSCNMRL